MSIIKGINSNLQGKFLESKLPKALSAESAVVLPTPVGQKEDQKLLQPPEAQRERIRLQELGFAGRLKERTISAVLSLTSNSTELLAMTGLSLYSEVPHRLGITKLLGMKQEHVRAYQVKKLSEYQKFFDEFSPNGSIQGGNDPLFSKTTPGTTFNILKQVFGLVTYPTTVLITASLGAIGTVVEDIDRNVFKKRISYSEYLKQVEETPSTIRDAMNLSLFIGISLLTVGKARVPTGMAIRCQRALMKMLPSTGMGIAGALGEQLMRVEDNERGGFNKRILVSDAIQGALSSSLFSFGMLGIKSQAYKNFADMADGADDLFNTGAETHRLELDNKKITLAAKVTRSAGFTLKLLTAAYDLKNDSHRKTILPEAINIKESIRNKVEQIYHSEQVVFVSPRKLRKMIEERTGMMHLAKFNGLYDETTKKFYINKQLSESERIATLSHEIRHKWGEFTGIQQAKSIKERLLLKRKVEIRAHYQEALSQITTPLSLEKKKELFGQIVKTINSNYSDSFLESSIESGWSASKKNFPKIEPFVSKKPALGPYSEKIRDLIKYIELFSKTGDFSHLEKARLIREQFSLPAGLDLEEKLRKPMIDAKIHLAAINISAFDFSWFSNFLNYLVSNVEEASYEFNEPITTPELLVEDSLLETNIELTATSKEPPASSSPVDEQVLQEIKQLSLVGEWLVTAYQEVLIKLQQQSDPASLALVQNTLDSLKYAIEHLPQVQEAFPRTLLIHQLAAIKDFITQLAENPQRRSGRFIEPTGAGKTTIYGTLALLFGWKTIILTQRENRLTAIKKEMIEGVGLSENDISILKKDNFDPNSHITIATYAGHRAALKRNDGYQNTLSNSQLIVCDEGHRSLGKETTRTLHRMNEKRDRKMMQQLNTQANTNAWAMALTATPDLSRKSVAKVFPHLIHRSSYHELVEAGVIKRFKVIQSPVTLKPNEVRRGMTTAEEIRLLRQKRVHESLLTSFCETRLKVPEKLYALATCLTIAECDRLKMMAEKDYGLRCTIITSREMKGSKLAKGAKKTPLEIAEEQLANGEIDMIISAEKLREEWDYSRLNAVLQVMASQSPARVLQPPGRATRRFKSQKYAYIFEPSWIGLSMVKVGGGTSGKTRKSREKNEGDLIKDPALIPKPTNATPLTLVDALELIGEENVDSVCETLDGQPLKRFRLLPVNANGEITIDETLCVALSPYAEVKGLDYSSLSRAVQDAKLTARGHARLASGRAVPVYENAEIEKLNYVQNNSDKPEISVDEKGLVTTKEGVVGVAIARFIDYFGLDYDSLERNIANASIYPIGKALSGDKVVAIYPYKDVAALPYVKNSIKYKDKTLGSKRTIVIDQTTCMSLNGFLTKYKLDDRTFKKAVKDAKLQSKGMAKTNGGQIVTVYDVNELLNLDYVKNSLKLRKLPPIDPRTGEVLIRGVVCIAVKRFADLNNLSKVLLLEAIEKAKIRPKGKANAHSSSVNVYPKDKVLATAYCHRLTLPRIENDNTTGIIKIAGHEYIAVSRYASYLQVQSDDLTQAIANANLQSPYEANANGQIVKLYKKSEVDKVPFLRAFLK